MTRILAVLLLAAAVTAAAATATTDPRQPRQRHTAADTRLARSFALRRGDLATGWTPAKPTPPGPPCKAEPDESSLVQTAKIDPTFTFRDGVTSIGSEVDVFRTARQARVDWRLSSLRLISACLLQEARDGVSKGVRVTLVSAQRLAAPALTERSLRYRLVFGVHAKRLVRLVTDVAALGRGRITIVLHSLTIGRPIPDAAERALLHVLAQRLEGGRTGV